jgi:uncharacterized protein YfiM (DUF2279 family)
MVERNGYYSIVVLSRSKLYSILFLLSGFAFSQSHLNSFLTPSDSLNTSKRNTLVVSEASLATLSLVGLNQLWYANYPHSPLHTVNDNQEWLQMDKLGHMYSSYHMGSMGANALKWSGASRKSQLLYGATLGLAFMTTVEVFDGYSSQWGFSWGDMAANTTGTAFFVSQELLWKEQRIVPKFSFHTTSYASQRPEVLGTSISQQILKDYNGQTYWWSINVHSFFKQSKVPTWLNLALGYGADGMLSGNANSYPSETPRSRQFYLSLDADLTKIKTKSHFLKTIFYLFNTIKIPAPSVEYKGGTGFKFHSIYF